MSIIIAILIFGVIVLIHEFGHFIVARWSKIDVLEFSIGMGPSIYTYHGKKTDYSIKLFPIGGSCRMAGEDSGEETEIKEGTFNSRPVWYRLAVIFAGPLFNFILSFILALFIVSVAGVDKPVISEVKEGYPAYNAGVMSGDVIKSIDKKDLYRELMLYLYMNPEKTIDLKVERDVNGTKEIKEFSITPKYDEENARYMIGIVSADREKVSNPLSVITYSIYEIKYNIDSIDFNDGRKKYEKICFRDNGHISLAGADEVSFEIADYLKKNYPILLNTKNYNKYEKLDRSPEYYFYSENIENDNIFKIFNLKLELEKGVIINALKIYKKSNDSFDLFFEIDENKSSDKIYQIALDKNEININLDNIQLNFITIKDDKNEYPKYYIRQIKNKKYIYKKNIKIPENSKYFF